MATQAGWSIFPTVSADIRLLEDSRLLTRLPDDIGVAGDLAYLTLATLRGQGFAPRRKLRIQDRPPDDVLYNRAFSQFRIIIEQTIGQLRRFQSITATDRNHRRHHRARVGAIAGLVNRLPRFA